MKWEPTAFAGTERWNGIEVAAEVKGTRIELTFHVEIDGRKARFFRVTTDDHYYSMKTHEEAQKTCETLSIAISKALQELYVPAPPVVLSDEERSEKKGTLALTASSKDGALSVVAVEMKGFWRR